MLCSYWHPMPPLSWCHGQLLLLASYMELSSLCNSCALFLLFVTLKLRQILSRHSFNGSFVWMTSILDLSTLFLSEYWCCVGFYTCAIALVCVCVCVCVYWCTHACVWASVCEQDHGRPSSNLHCANINKPFAKRKPSLPSQPNFVTVFTAIGLNF